MRLSAAALALAIPGVAFALPVGNPVRSGSQSSVSAPLWLMSPALVSEPPEENEPRGVPLTLSAPVRDPVLQSTIAPVRMLSTSTAFEGIGLGTIGIPSGAAFEVDSDPPDAVGDVGPNHYVQIVNSSFAVFAKSGTLLLGPIPSQTLFTTLGGACAAGTGYDGIVLYDPMADRWVISQLAFITDKRYTGPFLQCVAVSRTPDPTGPYAVYGFSYSSFNDYPKLGVWPDGYYVTYNMFTNASQASGLVGRRICVFDRVSMLAGAAADQQCVEVTSDEVSGLTPADFDGQLLPPAGERESIVGFFHGDSLVVYRYHVDWKDAANSAVDAVLIPAAPFQRPCDNVRRCIKQLDGPVLDSLSDRMMFRVAYRNMGGYASLVANHTVLGDSAPGVRWYEIRDPTGDPFVYQQGTYAPDANARWMASAAMDRAGNIGLGFSLSSSDRYAATGVTGRLASDPVGLMTQGESVADGAGAENDISTGGRWGDYSSMSVDPVDDCTFYYTSEYIPFLGMKNWRTRVLTFQLPGCTTAPDFAMWLSAPRASMTTGGTASFTVSTAALRTVSAGKAIQLAVSQPGNGIAATITPAQVAAGGTATIALVSDGTSAVGASPFTVSATADGVTLTAPATIAVIDRDFAISVDKPSATLASAGTTDIRVSLAPLFGDPEVVLFSVSGLTRGVVATLDPAFARVGGSVILHLQGAPFLLPAVSNVKVTATGSLVSHTAVVQLRTLFPPTVAIGDPRPFTSVSGVLKVAVTAGVAQGLTLKTIQLFLDDRPINGLEATQSPASLPWDSSSVNDGPHELTAVATDSDGNAGHSNKVAIWVDNGGCGGCASNGGGWGLLGLVALVLVARHGARCRARSASRPPP